MPTLRNDDDIRLLLKNTHSIAVVGLSNNPLRDSHRVARYLLQQGFSVIPVNPSIATVLGLKAFPSLEEINVPVDLVDVFRRPEHLPPLVDSAISIKAKALWTQLGVIHPSATEKASDAGLAVVVNRCLMVEHARLFL
jgi:predicted CoA-binding protein